MACCRCMKVRTKRPWIKARGAGRPHHGQLGKIEMSQTGNVLTDDGECSLREAIIATNTDAPVSGCPAENGANTIESDATCYVR